MIEWLTADLYPRWVFLVFTTLSAIGGYASAIAMRDHDESES